MKNFGLLLTVLLLITSNIMAASVKICGFDMKSFPSIKFSIRLIDKNGTVRKSLDTSKLKIKDNNREITSESVRLRKKTKRLICILQATAKAREIATAIALTKPPRVAMAFILFGEKILANIGKTNRLNFIYEPEKIRSVLNRVPLMPGAAYYDAINMGLDLVRDTNSTSILVIGEGYDGLSKTQVRLSVVSHEDILKKLYVNPVAIDMVFYDIKNVDEYINMKKLADTTGGLVFKVKDMPVSKAVPLIMNEIVYSYEIIYKVPILGEPGVLHTLEVNYQDSFDTLEYYVPDLTHGKGEVKRENINFVLIAKNSQGQPVDVKYELKGKNFTKRGRTGKDGIRLFALKEGEYTVKVNYFEFDLVKNISIRQGHIASTEFYIDMGKVVIVSQKQDGTNVNASIKIYNSNGKLIKSLITGEDGVAEVVLLPGEYFVSGQYTFLKVSSKFAVKKNKQTKAILKFPVENLHLKAIDASSAPVRAFYTILDSITSKKITSGVLEGEVFLSLPAGTYKVILSTGRSSYSKILKVTNRSITGFTAEFKIESLKIKVVDMYDNLIPFEYELFDELTEKLEKKGSSPSGVIAIPVEVKKYILKVKTGKVYTLRHLKISPGQNKVRIKFDFGNLFIESVSPDGKHVPLVYNLKGEEVNISGETLQGGHAIPLKAGQYEIIFKDSTTNISVKKKVKIKPGSFQKLKILYGGEIHISLSTLTKSRLRGFFEIRKRSRMIKSGVISAKGVVANVLPGRYEVILKKKANAPVCYRVMLNIGLDETRYVEAPFNSALLVKVEVGSRLGYAPYMRVYRMEGTKKILVAEGKPGIVIKDLLAGKYKVVVSRTKNSLKRVEREINLKPYKQAIVKVKLL